MCLRSLCKNCQIQVETQDVWICPGLPIILTCKETQQNHLKNQSCFKTIPLQNVTLATIIIAN